MVLNFLFSSYTMATASPDNIKQWKFPDGNFIQNLSGHTAIINTLALNQDNVLVSGGKQFFSFSLVKNLFKRLDGRWANQ